MFHTLRAAIGAPVLAGFMLAASAVPSAADVFSSFNGSWSGGGRFRLENGRSESLRCNAHYVPRGGALGLSLRCASASNRIELRANLVARGNRVSGTWEERSFNVSGTARGTAAGNSLRLGINGGGLSGSMVVTATGASQTISVRTDGAALTGINISLRRN